MRLRAGLERGRTGDSYLHSAVSLAGQQLSRTLESKCRADLIGRGAGDPLEGVRTSGTGRRTLSERPAAYSLITTGSTRGPPGPKGSP